MREWLKDIRESQHLSQAEISKQVNVTQPTYSNIEIGKRNPSVEAAKRIADVLGFPWTRFFEDEPPTQDSG